jgi:hypothetical protein
MLLYYIDKKDCRHISDITKAVSIIYQMEQEFAPYLTVEFLPNKYNDINHVNGGIIIVAGEEIIQKNYTFDDPNDEIELRNLLWTLLHKYHKIHDITSPNKCITRINNFQTNKVIQGWQEKKRQMINQFRPNLYPINIDTVDNNIKHWAYRDPTTANLNKNKCKKIRHDECMNNYPINTPAFDRCVSEVNWVCDRWYANNNVKQNMDKMIHNNREELYGKLKKNDMNVDKQLFDQIKFAGMYEDFNTYINTDFNTDLNTNNGSYYNILDRIWVEYDLYIIFVIIALILIYIYHK